MTASELRTKSVEELKTLLQELQREASDIRFALKQGMYKNTNRARVVRRDIARVLTVFAEKQNAKSAE